GLFPPRDSRNESLSVSVNAKIVVKELMEMSVKEETLKILAWIRMFWFDPRIQWDPAEYGGIKEVRRMAVDMWVPDMMITNSLENFEVNRQDATFPCIVGHNGLVYWSVPMILHTKCQADVTYFPFDQQNCKIKLNSWTYHEALMRLEKSDFNTGMESRVGNIEWVIDDVTSEKDYESDIYNHPLYPKERIRYPYIEYSIQLKRKPDFYVNSLVIPSLLLSWLGSVIFLLPSECGEKLGFSITLFLSLYVNQVIVAEFLPPSADSFPLIARFYTVISVMLGCSIILTATTLMLHFRITHEMVDENSMLIKFFLFCEKLGKSSFVDLISNFLGCMSKIVCCVGSCCSSAKSDQKVVKPKMSRKCTNNAQINIINLNCGTSASEASVLDFQNTMAITDSKGGFYVSKSDGNGNAVICEEKNKFQPPAETSKPPQNSSPIDKTVTKRVIADCSPMLEDYLKDIVAKLAIVAKDDAADIALKRWRLIAAGFDKIFYLFYTFTLSTVTVYFAFLAWEAKSYHAQGAPVE
ncbi:neuronal acetylcholine receptor subunit beta-3-like, partial [Convolutriloba macropyga]|uniref:neuronal acetylcholine receptor subunit beta-3-like n=1 Tax=Convolutriloba macropyga TaxID=536237 RepID=UPI003F521511